MQAEKVNIPQLWAVFTLDDDGAHLQHVSSTVAGARGRAETLLKRHQVMVIPYGPIMPPDPEAEDA